MPDEMSTASSMEHQVREWSARMEHAHAVPFVGAHAHHPVSRLEVPLQEQGPAVAALQVSRAAPSFQARSVDFDPMSSSCKTATAVTGHDQHGYHLSCSIITRATQQGKGKAKTGQGKARQARARILPSSLALSLTRNRVAQSTCQVPTSYHIQLVAAAACFMACCLCLWSPLQAPRPRP